MKISLITFLLIVLSLPIYGQLKTGGSTSNSDELISPDSMLQRVTQLQHIVDSILFLKGGIRESQNYSKDDLLKIINDLSYYSRLIKTEISDSLASKIQQQTLENERWATNYAVLELEEKQVQLFSFLLLVVVLLAFGIYYIKTQKELNEIKLSVEMNSNSINSHLIKNLIGGPLQRSIMTKNIDLVKTINEKIKGFVTLHYNINKIGEQEIRLDQEIKYLEQYMDIQMLRDNLINDAIQVINNLDPEELFDTTIPKMFIQPFLENAYEYTKNLSTVSISMYKEKLNLIVIIKNEGSLVVNDLVNFNSPRIVQSQIEEKALINTLRRILLYNKVNPKKSVQWVIKNTPNNQVEAILTFTNIF